MRTHDPLLLLPTSPAANGCSSLWTNPAPQAFRYTGRQSFGEVYTLCFKGGDKWRCPGAMAPRRERIALHALDGRLMAVPIRTTVCEMPHSVSRRFASGPRTDQTAWALTRTGRVLKLRRSPDLTTELGRGSRAKSLMRHSPAALCVTRGNTIQNGRWT